MKKKYFLIILISVSLIAIAFIFFSVRKQQGGGITITPRKPEIPNYITGKLPLEMAVNKSDLSLPAALPIISISKRAITRDNFLSFAQKLSLGANVEEFEDLNEGVKYYINTDKYFLLATPKNSVVKYGLSNTEFPEVVNKNISDSELTTIATKFLTDNGFYSENQIKPISPIYLKRSLNSEGLETTERRNSEVFQVNFLFGSNEYEIFSSSSTTPQVFVQILRDGQIYNSEILLTNNVQKGITEYPLKNYEEIISSINEAKLVNLSGDYLSPSDLTVQDFTNIKIDKIRIAYLLEENKTDLQPIFILEGPAVIPDSSINQATLYLPAFK